MLGVVWDGLSVQPFSASLGMFFSSQLVKSCNEGARAMERTEQMYTLQKQLEFGKKKVRSCRSGGRSSGAFLSRSDPGILLGSLDWAIGCRRFLNSMVNP